MTISFKQAVAAVLMAAVPALGALAAAPQGVADAGSSRASDPTQSSAEGEKPTRPAPMASGRSTTAPRAAASTTSGVPDAGSLPVIPDFAAVPVLPGRISIEEQLQYGRSPLNDPERKAAQKAWIDSFDSLIGSDPTPPPADDIPPFDGIDVGAIVKGAYNGR